ncbi:MAG TPA: alpha-xylosidase, partial [Segetibacter sp.]
MLNKCLFSFFLAFAFLVCSYHKVAAFPPAKSFVRTAEGVLVYPDPNLSGNAAVVRLQVITDKIIRVTASPTTAIPVTKSLVTVYNKLSENWTALAKAGKVYIKTPAMSATVSLATGAVAFFDKQGLPAVMERNYNGRQLSPAVFDGEPSYGITQTFETTADDAYYGLGQHQDDQFNYKGKQVFMFQNNTEVAIPFLISSKNYGILWDNYSISKIGDARNFMPLSSLKLYSKEGEYGWLTASYSNDRKKPNEVALTKAESEINYPFLDYTKNYLPKDFNIQNGVITWEGSVASDFNGVHKMSFLYAGYTKLWV